MEQVRIYRFSHQMDVIGQEVERPARIGVEPFAQTLWLKNARTLLYQPAQQGVVNISFAPPYRVPAVVGIDEQDRVSAFNRALIWTVMTPNPNILSTYHKDTIGIFTSDMPMIPKELKQ